MFKWLFENDFMPHGHCYFWRPDILWTHVLSDGIIAIAYFSIPITLVYFLNKRRDFPFRGILALFAAFIILCGTTHILGIITVWKPIYVIDGMVKAATALVSIATALVLVPMVPIALSMRSPAELEAANEMLRAEIDRRQEAEWRLQHAVESLRRSNEELEQFASVASHDLQSPLRAVVNFTQLLKSRMSGKLDKETEEFFAFIEDGGKQMQALINDLLQVARVSKEGRPAKPVSTTKVLQDALLPMQHTLNKVGATVEAADLPEVMGDPVQLQQLFHNLVGNAIKYVAPGTKPNVRISAKREQDYWHFIVADNGIGIPEHQLRSIFEIFRRLHSKDEYHGTGIGLAICKRVVEKHHGKIWAESTAGEGSQFHFTLPAVKQG